LLFQGGDRTVLGVAHSHWNKYYAHINVQGFAVRIPAQQTLNGRRLGGRLNAVLALLGEDVYIVGSLSES